MPLREFTPRPVGAVLQPRSGMFFATYWRRGPRILHQIWASSNCALALHCEFDFRHDRLIWDTGHQVYPHKLVTGRYHDFPGIRTAGGLMGYPNPHESEYDLFMTGHAGCSVSTAVGLRSGDQPGRTSPTASTVAVIGDGAFPSGIVFEALNNAGELETT